MCYYEMVDKLMWNVCVHTHANMHSGKKINELRAGLQNTKCLELVQYEEKQVVKLDHVLQIHILS